MRFFLASNHHPEHEQEIKILMQFQRSEHQNSMRFHFLWRNKLCSPRMIELHCKIIHSKWLHHELSCFQLHLRLLEHAAEYLTTWHGILSTRKAEPKSPSQQAWKFNLLRIQFRKSLIHSSNCQLCWYIKIWQALAPCSAELQSEILIESFSGISSYFYDEKIEERNQRKESRYWRLRNDLAVI